MRLARTLASLVTLSALVAVAPSRAAADEPSGPLAWGVAVGELATAGVFVANFGGNLIPNQGPGLILNFTPLLLGPAAAYGAHVGGLDAAPALAVHGAGWLGLDLFMLGALIDGRDRAFGRRVGTTAWTLGAIGAIAGGVIGATSVDGKDEALAWLIAPPAGFVAGGLVLGGILVVAGGFDGDKAVGQLATGAVAGMTVGLGVATYLAYRGIGDTVPTQSRLAPRIEPGPRRMVFSLGGAF